MKFFNEKKIKNFIRNSINTRGAFFIKKIFKSKVIIEKIHKVTYVSIMIIMVINVSYLGAFFIVNNSDLEAINKASAKVTENWPVCGWSCNANDVGVLSLSLGDSNGDPLSSSCIPGEEVSAYIWANLEVKNKNEYAVNLLGNIYRNYNGVTTTEEYDVCAGNLSKDDIQPTKISSFNWICGERVVLDNLMIAWGKNSGSSCGICSDYTISHCNNNFPTLTVSSPLISNFIFNNVCDGDSVSFTDTTTGGDQSYTYEWDFGDGNTSTEQSPSHTYSTSGEYTVNLTVTDGQSNVDSQSYDVTIYSNPSADFSATPLSGENPLSVDFTDSSTPGDGSIASWSWSFGDSNVSSEQNPSNTYSSVGTFDVELSVVDDNGCSDTTLKESYIDVGEAATCGDGQINQQSEECDDGANGSNTDACTDSCTLTYCGDGITQHPNGYDVYEDCEGSETQSCVTQSGYAGIETCSSCGWGDCVATESCGDGIINGNEQCDDSQNSDNTDGCTDQCTLTYCGDGIIQYPNGYDVYEVCEGAETQVCTTTPDGYAGIETCNSCTWGECISQESCGNGIIDGNEECDDSQNSDNTDGCTDQCTLTYCGDGIIQYPNGNDVYEVCEGLETQTCTTQDGYAGTSTCSSCGWGDCASNESCGDGIINGNEECDDGPNGSLTCTSKCTSIDLGSLEVCKYYDNGEIGSYDVELDTPLAWNFNLYDGQGSLIASSSTSNEEACITFENLDYDNYVIEEATTTGDWVNSLPGTGYYNLIINSATSTPYTFLNYEQEEETYSIHGVKWNDENGDGNYGEGEDYLPDWEIYLENGEEGFIASTTTSNETEHYGWYWFENLPAGDYKICEVGQNGWEQTYPTEQTCHNITLPADQEMTLNAVSAPQYDFGNMYVGYCGDGVMNNDEECDGTSGIEEGQTCSDSCTINSSGGEDYCGDGSCNNGETCDTCSSDCGTCSSGGGGGGGIQQFAASNPQIVMTCSGQDLVNITMTWLTNYSATSRVVYGTDSNFSLGFAPDYGYDNSTSEDSNKVTGHSVTINNLPDDTIYYFRGVSNRSNTEVLTGEKELTQTLSCTGASTNEAGPITPDNLPTPGGDGNDEVVVLGESGAPILNITHTVEQKFANPGDKGIVYVIKVTNNGNLDAFDTTLENVLPEGVTYSTEENVASLILNRFIKMAMAASTSTKSWDLGTIAPGETKEISYAVDISDDANLGVLTNTATVSASNHDPVSASAGLEVEGVEVLAETGFSMSEFILLMSAMLGLVGSSIFFRRKLA